MNEYFESLLHTININNNKGADESDNEPNDESMREPTDKSNDESNNESIREPSKSSVDEPNASSLFINGSGSKSNRILIIYSFVRPLIDKVKSYNIRDLSSDITQIIISIHKKLPNEYVKPDDITKQIITSIIDLIKSEKDQFKIFFLPALPMCSPFDLTGILEETSALPKIRSIFVNPSFTLMMKQIIADYKESSFRLTINQDLSYILKNYKSTNEETTHSIAYSLDELKSSMKNVKSAFINENDFNEAIDSFHQSLSPDGISSSVLFSHISKFKNIFDLNDLSTSSVDSLSEFIAQSMDE